MATMDKDRAAALLAHWESTFGGRRLSAAEAKELVGFWARLVGYAPDRFGHLVRNGTRRLKFGRGVVRDEERQGSRWVNLRSQQAIDMANNLLVNAAKAAGDETVERRIAGAKQGRSDQKAARARKAREAEAREEARRFALKFAASKFREETLGNLTGKTLPNARYLELKEFIETQRDVFAAFLLAGRALPGDEHYASVKEPPFLPVFTDAEYHWVERVGEHRYSVTVRHRAPNVAEVLIGRAMGARMMGGYLGVPVGATASGFTVYAKEHDGAEGDAIAAGLVSWDPARKRFEGQLTTAVARGKGGVGGLRAGLLWCRLMAGYGIESWVGFAMTDDGKRLLEALERRGSVRVLERAGNSAVLACA
jgi:hypothetical protein